MRGLGAIALALTLTLTLTLPLTLARAFPNSKPNPKSPARMADAAAAPAAPELIRDGWFSEAEAMWPGQRMSLQVEEVLFRERSDFQDILVFRSSTYGTVLVLDGVIQLTERDEYAYQEMIAHIPLYSHPEPKKVLIVGGGDGGVLREVARHACVESIDMCEIDRKVVEVAKRYFGETMATAYGDARLNLVHEDAAKFITREGHAMYDVIIVDSSDPVGPAESLFKPEFYEAMRDALNPGGIICTQGECIWLHLELIRTVIDACRNILPKVDYAYTTIPTYPSGQIGFILATKNESPDALRVPARTPSTEEQALLRYYTPLMHSASFVLPAFAQRAIHNCEER